jgi:hypothetical protein
MKNEDGLPVVGVAVFAKDDVAEIQVDDVSNHLGKFVLGPFSGDTVAVWSLSFSQPYEDSRPIAVSREASRITLELKRGRRMRIQLRSSNGAAARGSLTLFRADLPPWDWSLCVFAEECGVEISGLQEAQYYCVATSLAGEAGVSEALTPGLDGANAVVSLGTACVITLAQDSTLSGKGATRVSVSQHGHVVAYGELPAWTSVLHVVTPAESRIRWYDDMWGLLAEQHVQIVADGQMTPMARAR